MLGLGKSIHRDGMHGLAVLGNGYDVYYHSDFSTGVDRIKPYSEAVGNLTITPGETAPGSDDTGSWLKCVYTATMSSGTSGVQVEPFWGTTEDGTVIGPGDIGHFIAIIVTIHIVDGGGLWDPEGDSDSVSWRFEYGNNLSFTQTTALDTTSTHNTLIYPQTSTYNGTGQGNVKIGFQTADDMPQSGATFYIKDFVAVLGFSL